MKDTDLMRSLYGATSRVENGDANRDIIKSYLMAGGEGIELTNKQKGLLERWEFADKLLRNMICVRTRHQVAAELMKAFGIGKVTAFKDVVDAEFVFSSSMPLNKAYFIQLRIEFVTQQINECKLIGDHENAHRYEKVLTKWVELLPQEAPKEAPKTFIFNFDIGSIKNDIMKTEDAEFVIDEHLKALANGEDN